MVFGADWDEPLPPREGHAYTVDELRMTTLGPALPSRESVEAARGVTLTPDNLYPDRNCMHRNMGPPELFPCCGGRGYYPGGSDDSPCDRYCDCAAGRERSRTDGE